MQKANCSKTASLYDLGRPLSEENLDIWLNLINRIVNKKGIALLDLG